MTRNAEAVYAQAQLSNLRTYDLKYIAFSKQIELLQKQNASPAMIAELHKKALQALSSTYTSLENGISNADMGAVSNTENAEDAIAASPEKPQPNTATWCRTTLKRLVRCSSARAGAP